MLCIKGSVSCWSINKHPMGCEAQLAWKWPFTPTFLVGNFDL